MQVSDYLKQQIDYLYGRSDMHDQDRSFFKDRFVPFFLPLGIRPFEIKGEGEVKGVLMVGGFFLFLFTVLGHAVLSVLSLVFMIADITKTDIFSEWDFFVRVLVSYLVFNTIVTIIMKIKTWFRFEQKIKRSFKSRRPEFTYDEYKQAAEILREYKSMTYQKAIEKYPQKLIDLLIAATTLYIMEGKLRKLVSIKSIEEDREAGWDEE